MTVVLQDERTGRGLIYAPANIRATCLPRGAALYDARRWRPVSAVSDERVVSRLSHIFFGSKVVFLSSSIHRSRFQVFSLWVRRVRA